METVPLRTYSNSRRASRPAGQAAQGSGGAWPGSRSSHRCRSPRCRAAAAGTPRTPRRPVPRTARHHGGSAIPGPGAAPAPARPGSAPPGSRKSRFRPARRRWRRASTPSCRPAARRWRWPRSPAARPARTPPDGRCAAGQPGPGCHRGRNGAARSAPCPPSSPAPRRSERSPGPGRPAARSGRAAPAPAARTAAARSPPAWPCDAIPGPRCPGWRHAPCPPPGDQYQSPDNARIKITTGGGAPHEATMTPCPCHPAPERPHRRHRRPPRVPTLASLEEVTISWRGSYGYLTGYLSENDDDTIPLCRIQYLGDPDEWAFAIWQASTDSYAGSVLLDGRPAGHPTTALDTACTLYLADTRDHPAQPDEPLKDLRGAALGHCARFASGRGIG